MARMFWPAAPSELNMSLTFTGSPMFRVVGQVPLPHHEQRAARPELPPEYQVRAERECVEVEVVEVKSLGAVRDLVDPRRIAFLVLLDDLLDGRSVRAVLAQIEASGLGELAEARELPTRGERLGVELEVEIGRERVVGAQLASRRSSGLRSRNVALAVRPVGVAIEARCRTAGDWSSTRRRGPRGTRSGRSARSGGRSP